MKSSRFQAILGLVFLAIFLVFCHWQAPGNRLSAAELDTYLARIEQGAPLPLEEKRQLLAHLRAWGEADDGRPVYNLNLMRFFTALHPLPGTEIHGRTPQEANAYYELRVRPLLLRLGVTIPVAGPTQGVVRGVAPNSNLLTYEPGLDNWDRVLVVRYPTRRAFLQLLSDPAYLAVMPNKLASLLVVLTPFNAELFVPDVRFLLGMTLLVVFLAIGWWRAARRAAIA